MAVDPRLGRIADRHYGLISARQLRSLGLSREQRRHLLSSGLLQPLRRGVYRLMGAPPCWEQTVLAAMLAAGPSAVASHITAGAVWGLKHCEWRVAGHGLHVTAPRQLRLRGVTSHIAVLDRSRRRIHRGIPVTSPAQTIFDLTAALSVTELGECVDDALCRDLIHLDGLRALRWSSEGAVDHPSQRSHRSCPNAPPATTLATATGNEQWTASGTSGAFPPPSANTRCGPTAGPTGWTGPSRSSRSASNGTDSRPTAPAAASTGTATRELI